MTEVEVSYTTTGGNAEPVAWVSMPQAQWDVQVRFAQLAQARVEKAERQLEQWPRLVKLLRQRLAGAQDAVRDAVVREQESERWWQQQKLATAREVTEMLIEAGREQERLQGERDEARAALGRATCAWEDYLRVKKSWDNRLPALQRLKAILADPQGQQAAERWREAGKLLRQAFTELLRLQRAYGEGTSLYVDEPNQKLLTALAVELDKQAGKE